MKTQIKSLLALAALAAVTVTSASAQVIIPSASSATWYAVNTTSGMSIADNGSGTLTAGVSSATDGTNMGVAYYATQSLAVGASITLRMNLNLTTLADQNNNLRFGLFNSGGSKITANISGANPPAGRLTNGYVMMLATDTGTGDNITRYFNTQGNGITTSITSLNGAYTQLGADVSNVGVAAAGVAPLRMTITRTNATDLSVEAYYNNNLIGGGRTVASAASFDFDTVAFAVRNSGGSTYAVSDLSVVVVPEPTTWALLAGSLTTLMVFRRRRQS